MIIFLCGNFDINLLFKRSAFKGSSLDRKISCSGLGESSGDGVDDNIQSYNIFSIPISVPFNVSFSLSAVLGTPSTWRTSFPKIKIESLIEREVVLAC